MSTTQTPLRQEASTLGLPAEGHYRVSVCIATYARPAQLRDLLRALEHQGRRPDQVVVVDNDPAGSAQAVTHAARQESAIPHWHYAIQPHKNIAITRNWGIKTCDGDYIACIDDDEMPEADWLEAMLATALRHRCEVVLGPVLARLPSDTPDWVRRAGFFDWPRHPTGSAVPRNEYRIGNALLSHRFLRQTGVRFDAAFGLTGGEDGDLLLRLRQAGAVVLACDEAVVHESIPDTRLRLRWLLRRSLRGGQDYARHYRAGRYSKVSLWRLVVFYARATLQMLVAAACAVILMPWSRHRAARWLGKAAANLGKLTTLSGWRLKEYR